MMGWNQHPKATKKSILVRGCKSLTARMNEKLYMFEEKEKAIVEHSEQG